MRLVNGQIESEYTTGNKQWLARITGMHPKFKFEREFLNGTRRGINITRVTDGDILEEVSFSHSGKNRDTIFYIIANAELVKIQERDVILKFQG